MIADMISYKKPNSIVTKLFIRGRKLNISQSYFALPKNIRLNSTHYFVIKILNKQDLQQTAFNHLSDIEFKGFMNLYRKFTPKVYSLFFFSYLCYSCIRKSITFPKEPFRKNIKTNHDKIRAEELQYDINGEAAKISYR